MTIIMMMLLKNFQTVDIHNKDRFSVGLQGGRNGDDDENDDGGGHPNPFYNKQINVADLLAMTAKMKKIILKIRLYCR